MRPPNPFAPGLRPAPIPPFPVPGNSSARPGSPSPVKLERQFRFRLELFHAVPVINVVFLALFLFALSSRFTLIPGLTLNLPPSPFTLSPQQDPVVLSITAAPVPAIYLREERVSLEQLDRLLQDKSLAGRPLILRADKETPYEVLVSVSNLCLKRGFAVALACSSPGKF